MAMTAWQARENAHEAQNQKTVYRDRCSFDRRIAGDAFHPLLGQIASAHQNYSGASRLQLFRRSDDRRPVPEAVRSESRTVSEHERRRNAKTVPKAPGHAGAWS